MYSGYNSPCTTYRKTLKLWHSHTKTVAFGMPLSMMQAVKDSENQPVFPYLETLP